MEKPALREGLIDLAIIGGGPAGTAAALEARRNGLSVAIWERDRFPRDKVCGEFLSAESLPLLEEEISTVLARGAIIRRAEFISRRGRAYDLDLPHPGRGLSRRLLDQALWQAAGIAGTHLHEGTPVRRLRKLRPSHERSPVWELEPSGGGIVQQSWAVVVACGRWWKLEEFPSPASSNGGGRVSLFGPTAGSGQWVGAKAHFSGVETRDAVEVYFFPGGYCGLSPVENGRYNACCLVHRSLVRNLAGDGPANFATWLSAFALHPPLQRRLRSATQVSDTVTTAPVRPARRRADYGGVFLAGDSAGFLDPFTGDGISMAVHGGRLAARILAETSVGSRAPGDSEAASAKGWPTDESGLNSAVCRYRHCLSRATRRSYLVAGLLRLLVRAPEAVQDFAAGLLAVFGPRLLAETRWRGRPSRRHEAGMF